MNITNIISKLPRHEAKRYPRRSLSEVSSVIVHHSATMHGTQGPEDFARYHVNHHGWPGIAYTFAITPDGTAYQCTELNEMGYHCSGRNRVSLSMVLCGNFDKHEPTLEQLESATELVVYINETMGRKLVIDWHDNYRDTSCPGKLFPREKLVSMVAEMYVPPPPPDPEPEPIPEPTPEPTPEPIEQPGCMETAKAFAIILAAFVFIFFIIANLAAQ